MGLCLKRKDGQAVVIDVPKGYKGGRIVVRVQRGEVCTKVRVTADREVVVKREEVVGGTGDWALGTGEGGGGGGGGDEVGGKEVRDGQG